MGVGEEDFANLENSTGKSDYRAPPVHATEWRHGDDGALLPAAGITVGCAPKPFPQGADLLKYLYKNLLVCNVHESPTRAAPSFSCTTT